MRIDGGKNTVRSIVTALLIPLFFLLVQVTLDCSEAKACFEAHHYPKTQHYPKSDYYPWNKHHSKWNHKPKENRCSNPKPCEEAKPCPEITQTKPIVDAGSNQKKKKTSLFAGQVTLEGSVSSGSPGTTYDLEWYGPFGRITGESALVQIPQGSYTVSSKAVGCPESSAVETTKITIHPAFTISAYSKKNKIKLKWEHIRKMVRYDIYRSKEDNPSSFEKIGETNAKQTTFRDYSVIAETTYLYAVASITAEGSAFFSNVIAASPYKKHRGKYHNRPPLIYSPPPAQATPGFIYEYTVLATDINHRDSLYFSLTEAPSGMTINGRTGKISWTPTETGTFQVIVAVKDRKGLTNNQSFNIEVNAFSPTVALAVKPEDITQGQPGKDSATLSWCSTHAKYAIIEPGIGEIDPTGSIEIQPEETTEYTITAYGYNETVTDSATVTVTASTPPGENTPIANAGPDQEITTTNLFTGNVMLEGSIASNLPDDIFEFEWHGPFGRTTGKSASVQIPQGTYTVSLQAVGCPESSTIDYAEITVSPAFTISAQSKENKIWLKWAKLPQTKRYEIYRASQDAPYIFEKIGETTSCKLTYYDYSIANETTYLYAVAAIDAAGAAHYSNILASISHATCEKAKVNRQPLIYSAPISQATPGFIYEYTVLAADPDHDALSYSLAAAPSGMTIDLANGRIQWFPSETGEFQVIVEAADCKGAKDIQSFYIEATAPAPTVELTAQPDVITLGQTGPESSTLSWCSVHAEYAIIEPEVGEVNYSGNAEVQPQETTEYTITAFGHGGTAVDTATVTVNTALIPPPTVDILASPQAISLGDISQLYWHSANAETVTIDRNIGLVAASSDEEPGNGKIISPETDTVYTITATGPGGTATDSVTVSVTVDPPTVDISAVPELLNLGDSTQLFWSSTSAHSVSIDQQIGAVTLNSDESDNDIITQPQHTTTYTITAVGPGGTATDSVTVTVTGTIPPPTVDIVAVPEIIGEGGMSWLYWQSANADSVSIDQNIGVVNANGCYGGEGGGYPGVVSGECSEGRQVYPEATTTYTITATGPGGTVTDSVTVTVTDELPPTVNIIAIPEEITAGDNSWIYWHSSYATTVTIDQEIGLVAPNGCYGGEDEGYWEGAGDDCGLGRQISPSTTTTYTITASGPGGTVTDSVTVTVTQAPPPTVEIIADPDNITSDETSWLLWHSTNAENVSINQNIGVVALNGCNGDGSTIVGFPLESGEECGEGVIISPTITTTYTITAFGPGGVATDSVTVTVAAGPPPTVDITADPEMIQSGDSSFLEWHSVNATIVVIDQGIGVVALNSCSEIPVALSDSFWQKMSRFLVRDCMAATGDEGECQEKISVSPLVTTTYKITAYGPGGITTDNVTVIVDSVAPPTVDISADPQAITSGDTSWLKWHATNAEDVSIDQGIGGDFTCYGYGGLVEDCSDDIQIWPTITTTYTITATGPGGTAAASVTVYVDEIPPPTVTIIADPDEIDLGEHSWLDWYASNAETISIDQGVIANCSDDGYGGLAENCSDHVRVSPTITTTYTIIATGPGGTATASATVTVITNPPPTVTITADPDVIESGENSWLEWHATNAETVSIDQGVNTECIDDGYGGYGGYYYYGGYGGSTGCSDTVTVSPTVTTTYTITATGPGGTTTASVTVYVDEIPPPTVTITADPDMIEPGENSWLEWHATNAETVSIDQGVNANCNDYGYGGSIECGESVLVSPTITTTYTITATGPGGTVTDSITIQVEGNGVPTADFSAEPAFFFRGESTTLHWRTNSATSVSIDQGLGDQALNSDETGYLVSPEETTTYTLTATGPAGQGSVSVTVIVLDPLPPLVDLIVWPETIELKSNSVLAWSSTSADSVYIATDIGDDIGSVEFNSGPQGIHESPPTTTTYTITAQGPGGTASESVTVKVLPRISISRCQQTITAGDSCTVTITTINGEAVSVDQGVGNVTMTPTVGYETTGTINVSPLALTNYNVTATGNGGTSTKSFSVDVAPKVEFHSDEEIIEAGNQAHLHWTTLEADKVSLRSSSGVNIDEVTHNSESGGFLVSPDVSTTYILTAEGPTNWRSKSLRIYVNDLSKPPVITSFYSSPRQIDPGETAILYWETANIVGARIDNGIGDVPMFGSVEISPERSTVYTLVVKGPQGHETAQNLVRVRGTQDPDTFGSKYQDLVPENATISISESRFSILTGLCIDTAGVPLEGVLVSILGKAEYGTAVTDEQGRYSLPVSGNNRYTVVLEKEGLLNAHRKSKVINNQISVIETVTLIPPDETTTLIDFSSQQSVILYHSGSYLSDNRGQRRMSLTIPYSNAFSSAVNIITTEYSSPGSLPADMPPSAPYAYVAELGEATSSQISFTTPVIAWVDNFLEFPVGEAVPVGWYDTNLAQWIPKENGIVVQLVDSDNDGEVDGLDRDGDLQPDDLDEDGDTSDEISGLPLQEITAGTSFMRFATDHTGSWACSWPYAFMNVPKPAVSKPTVDIESCPSVDCSLSQQKIAIPGADVSIHYTEARVPAYQPVVTIPITENTVPANVESVYVKLTVAGKVYENQLNADPDQTIQIQWDGKDYLGNEITGPVLADLSIGYVYKRNYAFAGEFNHAFSQSGRENSSISGRNPYISWTDKRVQLKRITSSEDFIADGWTLSLHHIASPPGPHGFSNSSTSSLCRLIQQNYSSSSGAVSLYLGDGSVLSMQDRLIQHDIMAFDGKSYGIYNRGTKKFYNGVFGIVSGISVNDNTDRVYLSNQGFDVIWSYGANYSFGPNNGYVPSPLVGDYKVPKPLNNPSGIALDGLGRFFYADTDNHVVRSFTDSDSYDYRYSYFAGTGQQGFDGDGESALDAMLSVPSQLASDDFGNLYIADYANSVIRRVSTDGIIETIAGTGSPGSSGDGGPALQADIIPTDITTDKDGNIYIVERAFYRVRKIDVSGTITTIAGTGVPGVSGINGPAASATLYNPKSVAVDGLGNVFIGDSQNLYKIDDTSNLRKVGDYWNIGAMTTDMRDQVYFSIPSLKNVYKLHQPSYTDMASGSFYRFVDSKFKSHYFSDLGKHLYTGSPDSPEYSFLYDLDNLLVAIVDGSGNTILTINRDQNGKAVSLESAEGVTSLTIDENNHLVEVDTPANGSVSMAYNELGLLTDFDATFTGSIQGVVTNSSTGAPLEDVSVSLAINQSTLSVQTDSNGAYKFDALVPGQYSITYQKNSYFTQSSIGAITFGSADITHNVNLVQYPTLQLNVNSPVDGSTINTLSVAVTGQVTNNATVTVNGVDTAAAYGHFSAEAAFTGEGSHTITVVATDVYGQEISEDISITVVIIPLVLTIDTPLDGAVINGFSTEVIGQVNNSATVTVNGIESTVINDTFHSEVTFPGEGNYTIFIEATDSFGQHVTEEISVSVTYPLLILSISSPQAGTIFYSPEIVVTGLVSPGSEVTVNGTSANVTGDQFSATVSLMDEGVTTLTAEAVDVFGQHKVAVIDVIYHLLPSVTLHASSNHLLPDESVTLSWTSENSDHCVLEPQKLEVPCTGTLEVSPDKTTVYIINAHGLGKIARDSVTILLGNTYGNPSVAEQLHLEAINKARANPLAEAARLGIDLNEGPPSQLIADDPVEPLVFNYYLHEAAQGHTKDMVTNSYQAHQGLDGRSPHQRIQDAGYPGSTTGENLASSASSQEEVEEMATSLELHDNLFIDYNFPGRGHRINILSELFKEAGVGFMLEPNMPNFDYGGAVTINFGSVPNGPNFLLGVVYDDANNDNSYSAGEGLAAVEISVSGTDVKTFTASAGGYGIPISEAGMYTVTARLDDGRTAAKQFTIADQNVKIDFTLTDFVLSNEPPEVIFTAESDTLHLGQSTRLIWTTSYANEVFIDQDLGYVPLTGAVEISPTETTSYTITASNSQTSVAESITITVLPPLPAPELTATPETIWIGESSELSWTTTDTLSCYLDNGIGEVDLAGTHMVTPEETTTYTLTAVNDQGSITSQVTVVVEKPEVSLTVDRSNIDLSESANLQWTSNFSDECQLDHGIGAVSLAGTQAVSPDETTQYTLVCSKDGFSAEATVTVYVNDYAEIPIAELSADPTEIDQGGSTILNWVSSHATEFYIDNGIGDVGPYGQVIVSPETTTTYTFTAIGPAGISNSTVTIKVLGAPEDQPQGSFGILYQDMVPDDATVEKYDARRFSLIKGTIFDINELALPGVIVTIQDHPEYGSAETDDQGSFVLPVNGGTTFTVQYVKKGFFASQRQVYVPWNDIGIVVPVQMITEDPVATVVHFDGNENTVITHRASQVTDQSGSRAMTMIFKGNNKAYMLDENGVRVKELDTIITRATEYSTSKSMPAELPQSSAYTYCTELTADGIDRVEFDQPVTTFIDNFLGFDVGQAVPLGYYDRDKGVWVAAPNGVVVRLVDGDGNGIIDGLDSDGDGNADDLNGDGEFADEVAGLDPAIYQPGSTYWRAGNTHFTPWDWNWCSLMSLLKMLGYSQASADGQLCPKGDGTCVGSSVSSESQIFNEDIAIPGTGLTLAYSSDRTEGFKNLITVPVSGIDVPSSVKRIVVQIDIAGQILEKTVAPEPNQVVEFVWDGHDGFGNEVFHRVTAHVKIGYAYDSVYMESGYLAMSFAQFGTVPTSVPSRDEVITWRNSDVTINLADKKTDIAQGWSISAHHKIIPTDPTTLHKGDGSTAQNNTRIIRTVAGNGESGWPQSGDKAIDTPLTNPVSVALNSAGELFIANQVHATIIKVDKDDIIEVIAGGGVSEDENIPATSAKLDTPSDISFDSRGNLYLADAGTCKIRRIDKEGIITTVAGNGDCEYSGDNGPALLAGMMPNAIAADDFGNLYIAETTVCKGGVIDPVTGSCSGGTIVEGSYRVRKVSTNGIISTAVGTGEKYDPDTHATNGDGGSATQAYLSNPVSVSVDRDGNLYIADSSVIRKVNPSGIISTVAGNGNAGYGGDDHLATWASIPLASGVAFDNSGSFYFSQYYSNGDVIRKVTSSGFISTVVGEGPYGLAGDEGAATQARLTRPGRLAIDPAGFIYIPDTGNKMVRKVSIDSYKEGDINFAEPNGVGHLISAEGLHKTSYDLETGVPLLDFGYNTSDQLTTITDQFGNVVTISRQTDGTPIAITSPDGMRTELTIDYNSQLTHLTYPDGTAHHFEYTNNDGLITAKNEPNGNRFEHFFDENGRVYATNNLEGGSWLFSRTKNINGGMTATITTPNTTKTVSRSPLDTGKMVNYSVSPVGERIHSETSNDGLESLTMSMCNSMPTVETHSKVDPKHGYVYLDSIKATTYHGLELQSSLLKDYIDADLDSIPELVTHTITTNGKTATMVHDVLNSTRTSISAENRSAISSYDPNTLLPLTSSIPGLLDTEYSYFDDGKLQTVTTGSRSTSYTYDGEGNIETITDPMNRVTHFTDYDELGRVTRVVRADNTIMGYDYDENGNMTVLTTPIPADNTFDYNGVSKRKSFVTPLGSTTNYEYNEERQLTKVTLPSTKEIVNTYISGRLAETTTPEWTNTYEYFCGDLPKTITRGSETVGYSYDNSLVTNITQSGTITSALGFTYNNDFKLTSFTYAGATEDLGYDNDGLLTSTGDFIITRSSDNGLPQSVSDTTFTLSRGFNGYGEVDTVNINVAGSIFGYALTRYNGGRIETKTETIAGVDVLFAYSYDDLGRLLTVTRDGALMEEYRYDENGNRTYEQNSYLGTTGRAFSHSEEDHTITAGSITYEFDYDDNLASRINGSETTEYAYSSTGELQSVTLPDTRVISFVHDPLGRRIAKRIDGTIVEKYLWSGRTTLLAVYDGSNNLLQRFEYGDGRMPFVMTASGAVYYLAYDQVGSLRIVSDSTGNVVKRIDYDTFGNILRDSDPGFSVPFGFAGGLYDRDTGLVRFGYRDYLAEIGKWTAKDPIDFAAGDSNLYGYVQNDPVNFVDPEGLLSFSENFSRRKKINDNIVTKGIKTAASFAIGGSFQAAAKKSVGLGVGVGTMIKNKGVVPTLGRIGTLGNFVATAAFKSALVGASFWAGQQVGNAFGAYFDTIVDDSESFFGISSESLYNLGFGSGILNNQNECK